MTGRLCVTLLASAVAAAGEIETKYVDYKGGAVESKGYLAMPAGEGPHPGILVLHEWWGQNDYIRKRADMLAELGYAALAVDLFGEGKEFQEPQAGWTLMVPLLNQTEEITARFKAAMDCLHAQPGVDPDKLAAVGYSLGGTIALQMARNGLRGLDGVAAFHATLEVRSPNPPVNKLGAKILVCHAGEAVFDLGRPNLRKEFEQEMRSAQADLKFVEYPDAMDSFTNPEASKLGEKHRIPLKYDPAADASSWKELQVFLENLWKDQSDGQ